MPQMLAALILAAILPLLAACGQTGPLYLPQEAPVHTTDGESGNTGQPDSD